MVSGGRFLPPAGPRVRPVNRNFLANLLDLQLVIEPAVWAGAPHEIVTISKDLRRVSARDFGGFRAATSTPYGSGVGIGLVWNRHGA